MHINEYVKSCSLNYRVETYIAGGQHDYCNEFDLRKPLDRQFFSGNNVDCVSIKDSPNLTALQDRCAEFLAKFSRCGDLQHF